MIVQVKCHYDTFISHVTDEYTFPQGKFISFSTQASSSSFGFDGGVLEIFLDRNLACIPKPAQGVATITSTLHFGSDQISFVISVYQSKQEANNLTFLKTPFKIKAHFPIKIY